MHASHPFNNFIWPVCLVETFLGQESKYPPGDTDTSTSSPYTVAVGFFYGEAFYEMGSVDVG